MEMVEERGMADLLKALPESCLADFTQVHFGEGKITEWKGRRFEPVFPAETIKYAFDNHEPLENDILVASFVKTGTTWTREIVRQILYGRNEKLDRVTKELSFPIIYLETGKPSKYNIVHNLPLPRRYHVTHLPTELLNMKKYMDRKMKIIYTLRNPKDQLVSFFHHIKNFPYEGEMAQYVPETWKDFLDQEIQGKFPHNLREGETYFDHILSWLSYIKDNSVLAVVYEEMKQDLVGHVRKIAQFLGEDISDNVVREIADNCSIGNMKKAAQNSNAVDLKSQLEYGFLRRGEVGGWKEYFTVEQSELLDRQVEEKLSGTGINFIYE